MKYLQRALALICLITFLHPSNAYPWSKTTHEGMTKDASSMMAARFLTPQQADSQRSGIELLIYGSTEPDTHRIISHVDLNACARMVQMLATKSTVMIIDGADWSDVLFTMGQASHYIEDMNCPHHGIGWYDKNHHKQFENLVRRGYWQSTKFDGFQYIKDYKVFAYNAAKFSERYIEFANRLRSKNGRLYVKLITPLWDHAVNDVIDLWLTIMYNGLGEDKYREWGLPLKKGTRSETVIECPPIENL